MKRTDTSERQITDRHPPRRMRPAGQGEESRQDWERAARSGDGERPGVRELGKEFGVRLTDRICDCINLESKFSEIWTSQLRN